MTTVFRPLMQFALLIALAVYVSNTNSVAAQDGSSPPLRWWKGNLHTHSLWSDGDEFPEMIADWYDKHDYNFLAFSDHNILSEGMRWMSLSDIEKRADDGILDRYRKRWGTAWVETRGQADDDAYSVRLKPIDEFAPLLERAGEFILIPGEEISDSAEGKPVHMNATNVGELIEPSHGETVRETIANNLRAVLEHEKASGRQVLPHLNHPNFGYAVTADDLAYVIEEKFFEVYNGHPAVNQLGDKTHPSIERMWDEVNSRRLALLDAEPLMGIATDDSHEYHGKPGSRPGRGWVMVKARYLTPEHIIRAMKDGDFYASSGVVIKDIQFDQASRKLQLAIQGEPGVRYTTQFVTSLRPSTESTSSDSPVSATNEANSDPIGVIVSEQTGLEPEYTMQSTQLYIRAVVTSSKDHTDPSLPMQKQQAWTQPVGWTLARARKN